MADIKRDNEVIRFALHGRRDQCKTDEEREFYDIVREDMAYWKRYGIAVDLIHEAPD